MLENMNKKIWLSVILTTAIILSDVATAAAFTVTKARMPGDTKSAELSVLDKVWLSAEPVAINSITRVNVLVNRVTKKVEYVWSYQYNRYVRPKLSMPNIQNLYDFARSKRRQNK
jgi:hypothetical protein